MRVLVCNRSDSASVNIRDRLLETGTWELSGVRFRGAAVWARSEALLIEVEGPTITDERLGPDLQALNLPFRDVWFLSRHRAESGHPSLTAHPIGNHHAAQFGGQPGTLSPSAPRDMGSLLRRLKVRAAEAAMPHSVTYEATHHGPLMPYPSLFVEIGSSDAAYEDPVAGRVLAAALTDVLGGEGSARGPILVGVGGGHYHPRQTDLALAGTADFGHLVPAYAVAAADGPGLLARAVASTPGCTGVHIHRKGLKGPERQKVVAWCAELGVEIWEGGDDATGGG